MQVTIVTLKRFECIEVADLDEVEEEGISEDDFFEASAIDGIVLSRTVIKPGFVTPVLMELTSYPQEEETVRGIHVLVAKHTEFGSEAYLANMKASCNGEDSTAREQRVKVAAKCDISRQIVTVTKEKNSGKFFKDLVSLQVKVLNPGDVDLVLEVGDVVASIKVEKIPASSEVLSYTQVKEQKSLEEARRQDNMLREADKGEKKKKKKKKNKKKTNKANGGKESTAEQENDKNKEKESASKQGEGAISFDLDALDFEPLNEGEESSDVSLSDSEPEDREEETAHKDTAEKRNEKRKDGAANGTTVSRAGTHLQDEPVTGTSQTSRETREESAVQHSSSLLLHENTFYGLINSGVGGGLAMPAGSHQYVQLRVKPSAGYSEAHMIGRKCHVSRRAEDDCSRPYRKDNWKFTSFDIPWVETVARRCDKTNAAALVNVWILNKSDKAVFFPNDMAVANVKFLGPKTAAVSSSAAATIVQRQQPPQPKKNPAGLVPSVEELGKITVKDLKAILTEHNLQLSGLKKSLVQRLHLFYKEDPELVDQRFLKESSAETAAVAPVPAAPWSSLDPGELENVPSQPLIVTLNPERHGQTGRRAATPGPFSSSAAAAPYTEGSRTYVEIPTVDHILVPPEVTISAPPKLSSSAAVAEPTWHLTDAEKEARKTMKDKAAVKLAEIKALENSSLKFHEAYYDISLDKEEQLPGPGDAVILVKLGELELFSTELADRHVFVHYRAQADNTAVVKSQICKVNLEGKSPTVELLVRSKNATLGPFPLFLRLRIERTELDTDNQFFLPVSDTFHPTATETLFDLHCSTVASTLNDVVLLPKSFHTERCVVPLKPEELATLNDALVILERTPDHGMNIGMRKMILVPKVLSRLACDQSSEQATVEVRIYNASKQRLRLSKNTNIARIFLPRYSNFFSRRTTAALTEEKSLHAGDKVMVRANLRLRERVADRMPALVVACTNSMLDSQLAVQSGLTVVRRKGEGSSAYVDVSVINPSSKYIGELFLLSSLLTQSFKKL